MGPTPCMGKFPFTLLFLTIIQMAMCFLARGQLHDPIYIHYISHVLQFCFQYKLTFQQDINNHITTLVGKVA